MLLAPLLHTWMASFTATCAALPEIEGLAANIAGNGMLQNLVVEPEREDSGRETGFYFVTIGEGRRLAQLLLAKPRQIKKTDLIRCVLDIEHDAHEISLAENVIRSAMHPADEFEAFALSFGLQYLNTMTARFRERLMPWLEHSVPSMLSEDQLGREAQVVRSSFEFKASRQASDDNPSWVNSCDADNSDTRPTSSACRSVHRLQIRPADAATCSLKGQILR